MKKELRSHEHVPVKCLMLCRHNQRPRGGKMTFGVGPSVAPAARAAAAAAAAATAGLDGLWFRTGGGMTPPVGLCTTEDVNDGDVKVEGGLIVSGIEIGGLGLRPVIGVETVAPVVLGPVTPALSISPAVSIRSRSAITAGFFFF